MPSLDEFLNKNNVDLSALDDRVEVIEQMRPCSKCDLFVHEYYFNNKSLEMFWTCKDGHKTVYRVG
jgi:hypothetical protein